MSGRYTENNVPGSFGSGNEYPDFELLAPYHGPDTAQTGSMNDRSNELRALTAPIQTSPEQWFRATEYPMLPDSPFSVWESPPKSPSKDSPFEDKATEISELETSENLRLVDVYKAVEQLEKSREECDLLRKQVRDLQRNLQEQEDFIFSLQPHREVFTGSDAALEFKSLCGSVENWVQTILGDAIDDRKLEKQKDFPEKHVMEFLELLSQPSKDAFSVIDTDVYQVIAFVMRFLCHHILDKDLYCVWYKARLEFLNDLGKSLGDLQPRRDLMAQRSWRSETLTAVANLPGFISLRDSWSNRLSTQLSETLSIFLHRPDKRFMATSVQKSIIEPAILLAHKMHLSVDRFSIEWSPLQKIRHENRSNDPYRFEPFDSVDISGRTLKFPAAAEGSAGRGFIVYLFDLFPKLVYEPVRGDVFREPQILKKSKILVVATKREDGPFHLPRLIPTKPVTLIGWMDETLAARTYSPASSKKGRLFSFS